MQTFNENIFQCKNSEGKVAICSNNCRGVNPNAIIIGGAAIAIAATVSGNLLLTPAAIGAVGLGAAGAGAVGIGAASGMFVNQCPNRRPCQVSHQYTGSITTRSGFYGFLLAFLASGTAARKPEEENMLPASWNWTGEG